MRTLLETARIKHLVCLLFEGLHNSARRDSEGQNTLFRKGPKWGGGLIIWATWRHLSPLLKKAR
ncbi:hypothetical protein BN77_p10303 [Rhizobium mesoamericanum STM3625]|uniref:Uncharacterized protein n=1 Tax=Rhizobium mesoamericanum STM3625 TaxID=1211777 RepID=K0Q2X6_9HYPH|nr:hypothetical protein BN77_p10303 [Rhizobium mesoamericanum STM3625]